MSTVLPILAVSLVLAASLLSKPTEDPSKAARVAGTIWSIVLAVLFLLAAFIWHGWAGDPMHVAFGMLAGVIGAIVTRWLPSGSRVISSIALAGAAEGLVLLAPPDWRLFAQLGAVAGASLAAWLLDVRSKSDPACAVFPVALAAVMAVDFLGGKAEQSAGFALSGTLFAVVAGAAGVVAQLVTMRGGKAMVLHGVAILLLGGGAFVVASRYLQMQNAWVLFLAGMVLALLVNWLMENDAKDSIRPMLSTILWIGLATIGFGLERGFGMALGLMGGVAVLLILGNVRALLTLGPFAGLVMYRVFREVHVDATRALDIGQHYALVGLALGALSPLMPVEWLRSRTEMTGPRIPVGSVLWLLLLAVIPVGVAMVLGPKGVVGYVAGLGFAAFIECAREKPSVQSLSLGIGLAAATTFAFEFLGDNATLSRDEKISILIPLGICLSVIAIVLVLVSPRVTLRAEEAT